MPRKEQGSKEHQRWTAYKKRRVTGGEWTNGSSLCHCSNFRAKIATDSGFRY